MEKINLAKILATREYNADEILAICVNEINEIIDELQTIRIERTNIDTITKEDRLKTLEDKIEFIMSNASQRLSNFPLQDLWDEQLSDKINDGLEKMYPTVKECNCKCHRERGTVPHPEDDCDHKDNRYWNKMPPDPFMRVNKDDEIDLLDYKELNLQIYSGGALIKQQTIYCKEANIKYIEITAEPKNE